MSVFGVDLSNYQGEVTAEYAQCLFGNNVRHAVIRASLETAAKSALALRQARALIAAGIKVTFYVWAYADQQPIAVVQNSAALLAEFPKTFLWVDLEDVDSFAEVYPGDSQGGVNWLQTALDEIERQGWHAGLYSASWCFIPICGTSTAFARYPLWVAAYDGNPDIAVWPRFGGFTEAVGKQYIGGGATIDICGTSVDLDSFTDAYLAMLDAPPPAVPTPTPPPPDPQPVPVPGEPMTLEDQINSLIDAKVQPLSDKIAGYDATFAKVQADVNELSALATLPDAFKHLNGVLVGRFTELRDHFAAMANVIDPNTTPPGVS